jgi:hypothetical protein
LSDVHAFIRQCTESFSARWFVKVESYSRVGGRKRAYPDVWDLPGGLIGAGESELDALRRELHEELGVQIATGSVSHLCRLTAGPAEGPALLSAWLVRDWQGTPAKVLPRSTMASAGSALTSFLLPPTYSCARLDQMRCGVTAAELQRAVIGR